MDIFQLCHSQVLCINGSCLTFLKFLPTDVNINQFQLSNAQMGDIFKIWQFSCLNIIVEISPLESLTADRIALSLFVYLSIYVVKMMKLNGISCYLLEEGFFICVMLLVKTCFRKCRRTHSWMSCFAFFTRIMVYGIFWIFLTSLSVVISEMIRTN